MLVRLQSQPAQVLGCLIEQSGDVVTRESLCKAVWGSETFVDFERGLNFCVAQVRSALGDDSTTPRYVRTIPRRGYQFIAPVEQVPDLAERAEADSAQRRFPAKTVAAVSCALILLAIAFYAGYRVRHRQESKQLPIVAVVRFDNETGDASMVRFSDGLTDSVVEQLSALGQRHYAVIGNAKILRLPRDQRDLQAIAESLHARYVVLGQVQGQVDGHVNGQVQDTGSQIRILAHLIRLPDQTHLWVTRMDHSAAEPLSVELEAAQKIAAGFSQMVVKDSSGSPLPPFPNK